MGRPGQERPLRQRVLLRPQQRLRWNRVSFFVDIFVVVVVVVVVVVFVDVVIVNFIVDVFVDKEFYFVLNNACSGTA
jgi:hypothetical protein